MLSIDTSVDKELERIKEAFILENILKTKRLKPEQMMFASMTMPPWERYLSQADVDYLHLVATDPALSAKSDKRHELIKSLMEARGFKRLAGGTNRDVFTCYENPDIVAKISLDKVGLGDNWKEYNIQEGLFPRCTKMFQVCPSGVVGFSERVTPILTRKEYNAYLPMIYMLMLHVLGEYAMDDVGGKFFKNIGLRKNYGAVLLDYPYLYRLGSNSLVCNSRDLFTGRVCGGEIDYDQGYNFLYCTRCGKTYLASEIESAIDNDSILVKHISKGGRRPMFVQIRIGDKVITGTPNSDSLVRPHSSSDVDQLVHFADQIKAKVYMGANCLNNDNESTRIFMPTSDCLTTNDIVPDIVVPDNPSMEAQTHQSFVMDAIDESSVATEKDIDTPQEDPVVNEVIQMIENKELPSSPTPVVDTVENIPPIVEATVEEETPVEVKEEEVVKEEEKVDVVETKPSDEDEFPPQQWKPKKKEDKSVIKPYYLIPASDESSGQSSAPPKRTVNPYKQFGGFLGGDSHD